ncbi:hypothetical protein ACFC08_17765 [Streptomyces sp. NPDC056112]|uniref:hypothetical protein n=1 Tax=Streptomyces sp. NPDC056112 TaxID=3345715 RepID=UPI0035E39093
MAVQLDSGHAWDVYQTVDRRLDDPVTAAQKWVAAVVVGATGIPVVKSAPQNTEQAARADAERKYAAWKQKNGAS